MENPPPAPAAVGGRKEPSIDPVKAQGILRELCRKEKYAFRLWRDSWSFYTRVQEIQEEVAQKLGMSLEEYRAAKRYLNCQLAPKQYPVTVEPSPKPLPLTSTGMIGHRIKCPLERYGKLVKTPCDYPKRPPLPPGEVYDPFKQTMFFLGSLEGDPISYTLPPAVCEVNDEMWARPQQLDITQFKLDVARN